MLASGPSGTGKTYMAVGLGAQYLLEGKVDYLVLSRPLQTCDEEVGFLPGNLDEKILPYMRPMLDILLLYFSESELQRFIGKGIIRLTPLALMRGLSFHNSFVVVDECQNATYKQLKMLLTRFGQNCKMVLCGDIEQSDKDNVAYNPFLDVKRRFKDLESVGLVRLTEEDICRSGLVRKMLERL